MLQFIKNAGRTTKNLIRKARDNTKLQIALILYVIIAAHIANLLLAPIAAILFLTSAIAMAIVTVAQGITLFDKKPRNRSRVKHIATRIGIGLLVIAQAINTLHLLSKTLVAMGVTSNGTLLIPLPHTLANAILWIAPIAMIAMVYLLHQDQKATAVLDTPPGSPSAHPGKPLQAMPTATAKPTYPQTPTHKPVQGAKQTCV